MARFQAILYCSFLAVVSVLSLSITATTTTNLGIDVEGSARLNGGSFQQSVVTSYNGWWVALNYFSPNVLGAVRMQWQWPDGVLGSMQHSTIPLAHMPRTSSQLEGGISAPSPPGNSLSSRITSRPLSMCIKLFQLEFLLKIAQFI
jgi:hypothetical protein